ncbi:MAG: glycosyltransferase [Proteobacteria bacterium]|nr:glycosyltransferase [Pseudomonadota bacterium]
MLRAKIRRLSGQLDRKSAELEAALARSAELEAAFAIALAERDKILTSTAWRATRAMQKAIGGPRRALSRLLPTGTTSQPPIEEPATEPAPPPAEPRLAEAAGYERWVDAYGSLSGEDRRAIAAGIKGLGYRPAISIVVANSGTPARRHRTVTSLESQLYPGWDLCSGGPGTGTGDFLAFMEAGDRLAEQALFEVALTLDAHPDADIVYTDEDVIGDDDRRRDPVFKPAFSLDLLLGTNMIGRLAVYRRSLLEAHGLPRGDMNREQEHDLALRAAMATVPARIRHIAAVLYHRAASGSAEQSARPDEAEPPPILDVPGLPGVQRVPMAGHPGWSRVIWPLPDPPPRVSLIVPTRDRADLLARCVVGLLHRTDYPDFEVLIIDNDSQEAGTLSLFRMLLMDHRVRVIRAPGAFNFSALNNLGFRAATGTVIVMINNDIDVIDDGWLREMVSHAVRPDVGAVGAKLLYGDGRIQHAGIVLGVGRHDGGPGIAGHFGHYAEGDDDGYLGQFALTREVSAVTGACLALRREVWNAVGGLNETDLPVAYNDVELCIRIRACGLRIIWTPFAQLYHLESASRAREETPEQHARARREARYMRDQWGPVLDDDPFYNLNFDRKDHLFELAPCRPRPWLSETVAAPKLTE